MAIAVACFERALQRLGVSITADIATLLDVLWQFPAASDLGAWQHDLNYAAAPGLAWNRTVDSPEDLHVLSGVNPRLRRLYDDVEEIGHGNLYGATRSELTLKHILETDAPTWRALARRAQDRFSDEWRVGSLIPGHQAFGIALCHVAAETLGEDPTQPPWN